MDDILKYNIEIQKNLDAINSFRSNIISADMLVFYCVDNSTIRAFGATAQKYSPLSLFRNWAYSYLTSKQTISRIEERLEFDEVHAEARYKLMRFWNDKEGKSTIFYFQANKLIDLLFKFMSWCNLFSVETRGYIFENAHVPLDRYALSHLKKYSSNCNDIPASASMGYVKSEKEYQRFQTEIKRLCGKYPGIVFDIVAQNSTYKFDLKEK